MDDVVLFPLPGDGAIRGRLIDGLFISRDRRLVRWYDERMDSIRPWAEVQSWRRHFCAGPSCCADPVMDGELAAAAKVLGVETGEG